MYKMSHRMLLSVFENMSIYTSDGHDYYTRQADLLYIYIQYAPTKRSQRTIKHYGTKLWNIISGVIEPDCAIGTLKQDVMAWFLFFFKFQIMCFLFIHLFIIYLFLYSFFLFSFQQLLTKWYPPALCTCSCSPCFNELAVLITSAPFVKVMTDPNMLYHLTIFFVYYVLALLIIWL